jgi:AcrR family transcriptional regulator
MHERELRDPLTGRAAAIRTAARELLEGEGPHGLAMRPLAERVGAHPPAVYRHFPDKRAVERAVVLEAFYELGGVLHAARRTREDPVGEVCRAYRAWAVEHPHLFRLMFGRPPDDEVPTEEEADAEGHTHTAMLAAAGGNETAARAMWACAHGLVTLEIDRQVPPGADLDAAWEFTLDALRSRIRELE